MSFVIVLIASFFCSGSQGKRVQIKRVDVDAACTEPEKAHFLGRGGKPEDARTVGTKGWSPEKAHWDCGLGLRILECDAPDEHGMCTQGVFSQSRTKEAVCLGGGTWSALAPTCAPFSSMLRMWPFVSKYYDASPWVAGLQEKWTPVRQYKFARMLHRNPDRIHVNVFKPGDSKPRNHRCYKHNSEGCELQCYDADTDTASIQGASFEAPPFGYRGYWQKGVTCTGSFYLKRSGMIPKSDDNVTIQILMAQDITQTWNNALMMAAQETRNGKSGPWMKVVEAGGL